MRVRFIIALLLAWPALQAAAATDTIREPAIGDSSSPASRVAMVARAALAGPDYDTARAGLDAVAASSRVAAHPGSPYVELQREGITRYFDEAANATWFLRFGAPFNAPWNGGSVRDSVKATDLYVTARKKQERLETAGSAVRAWLDLAAANERLAVREAQLTRLEAGLELQNKKLELGEISGAEVTQLRLARFRLVGEVGERRTHQVSASGTLTRLAGAAAPRPREGDLSRLVDELGTPLPGVTQDELQLESTPALVAAAFDTDRIRLRGERDRKTIWGRPEAEISWEHIPDVNGVESFDAVGLRVRVPLPIGGAGKRQSLASAAMQEQARADQERTRRELQARIRTARERLNAATEILEELGKIESDLPAVERSIDERYRLGALVYLEYLDGLVRLDEVRVQAIEARHAVLLARLELAVLTGDTRHFPLPDPDQETDR